MYPSYCLIYNITMYYKTNFPKQDENVKEGDSDFNF